MLVLSRKEGESVMIGENISITILSIDPGGQVNIGISAPRDVLVLRSELQKAVCENQDAASTAPPLWWISCVPRSVRCAPTRPPPIPDLSPCGPSSRAVRFFRGSAAGKPKPRGLPTEPARFFTLMRQSQSLSPDRPFPSPDRRCNSKSGSCPFSCSYTEPYPPDRHSVQRRTAPGAQR